MTKDYRMIGATFTDDELQEALYDARRERADLEEMITYLVEEINRRKAAKYQRSK